MQFLWIILYLFQSLPASSEWWDAKWTRLVAKVRCRSSSVWGWDPGHHHSAITLGPGRDWGDVWPVTWLKISSPSLSPCVNSSLLSAPSSPPFHIKLFFPPQHHLPSDTCSISFSPFKPQPSSIHLLLSSAPYPSCSTFVAVTDCRDWDYSLAKAHKLGTPTHSPSHLATRPSLPRIDYPTFQGDNQWAWPDFETWWLRACV